ncbi:MAG: HAMP domain-containing histidine kinase [Chitinophagaceae bacterium]|nr:MAG: HAMP domain-containing histidine kinase [Chitinophagaceae bacterium]
MKRIFTVITILISISLIGIIFIQISWLRNMIILQEDQVTDKIQQALNIVGDDLRQYKGNYMSLNRTGNPNALMFDDLTSEFLKPVTLGKRFSGAEIDQKIREAFKKVKLEKMNYEFMLATFSPRTDAVARAERISKNFAREFEDSVNNLQRSYPLFAPSGSAAENLAEDEVLSIVALNWKSFAVKSLKYRILTAVIFTIIIITAFYLTVRTMLRQKKLGEIKNDFINNMTHEFKTPIATISLAVDAMKNEKVLQDRTKISYFSSIIKEENQRMNRQVETILKASQLERQEVDLNMQPLHVHKVITDVVENFALQLHEKQGSAELSLQAANDLINADEVHFSNLINNLIDNAVKYSKENVPLKIKLTTTSSDKLLTIRVEDNGIGMSKETIKRVFERFYRAHTGNLHNVKGFGLGLSYVKTMVEGHGGAVRVDSVLGRGSIFIVDFPLYKEKA